MLTSKQRSHLRAQANQIDTIFQVGKNGINDELITHVSEALVTRELIKLRVLETAPVFAKEAAFEIAERTKADVVQVIGTRFVLYKRNHKNPKITIKK